MKRLLHFIPTILIVVLLLGCSSPPAEDPEISADTAVPVTEPTREPTATRQPTSTATPVLLTATPKPTRTYSPIAIGSMTARAEINATNTVLRLSATPTPTEAPPLFSEGMIWNFRERGYGYIYEGNVCLNMTGTPVYLGEASDRVDMLPPSPNGLYIAYQFFHTNFYPPHTEVRIARTDGSQTIIALTSESIQQEYPAAAPIIEHLQWMPSSTQLLFNTSTGDGYANDDLYRFDAAVPQLVEMVSPGEPVLYYTPAKYTVSPDGQWIAVSRRSSLGFLRSDGGEYREKVFSFEWVDPECPGDPLSLRPVWKPDSSGVTFAVRGWVPADPSPESRDDSTISAWYVPVAGEPQKLGEFSPALYIPEACLALEGTVISPDHQWLGYAHEGIVGAIRVDGSQTVTLMEDISGQAGLEWLDNTTMRLALGYSSPLQLEFSSLADWRYYTAALDGTVTPLERPLVPENPLISCEP